MMKSSSRLWLSGSVAMALAAIAVHAPCATVDVPATRPWTPTGLTVEKGQWLVVEAGGKAEITHQTLFGRHDYDYIVGPEGTYVYPNRAADAPFPLAAGDRGPSPAYALIGRFGEEGDPFLVGARCTKEVTQGGELFLGINDYRYEDNSGLFTADISVSETPPPSPSPPPILSPEGEGKAVEDACVVMLFVDGLRPDVVKEMAEKGYLPNIKELFIDGGVEMAPTFSVFPSVTVPTATTFLTGCSPQRTGLKTQYYFDRKSRYGSTFFKPFGPRESANWLRPTGLRRILLHCRRLFTISARRRAELRRRLDGVKTLFDYMQESGIECASGIVPVQPSFPSRRWTQRAMNTVPLFRANKGKFYGDQVNEAYSMRHIFNSRFRVAVLWFPNVDTRCHDSPRGQFGGARRELVRLDRWIGEMVERLKTIGKWESTYLLLFSDHGHMGGAEAINQQFDIAGDLLYPLPRDEDGDGRIDPDSGLGMNVKAYRYNRFHKWRFPRRYAYLCSSDAAEHLYLPHGGTRSRISGRVNGYGELTRYSIAGGYEPVDLVEHLLNYDAGERNRYPGLVSDRPIDLVMLRLDDSRILVASANRGRAVIERGEKEGGGWLYRYVPVSNLREGPDGIVYEAAAGGPDPFGYREDAGLRVPGAGLEWLTRFHDDREWLSATRDTRYPDGVVAVANSLFWDDSIRGREERNRPDLIVSAARGWTIGRDRHPGTAHGYPLYESMRITFFVHGPNVIRGGSLDGANRTVDILPTVLDIVGVDYDRDAVDGRPIRAFYEGAAAAGGASLQAPYRDVAVSPEDIVSPFMEEYEPPPRPFTAYDPSRAYDPHIIAVDIAQLPSLEVVSVIDFLADLVIPGDRLFPVRTAIRKAGDAHDNLPDSYAKRMSRQFLDSLLLDEIALSEASVIYSLNPVSGNNIDRAQLITDWFQRYLLGGRRYEEGKQGKKKPIPVHHHVHAGIDAFQSYVDGTIRELVADLIAPFDNGLYGAERGLELVVRAFQKEPRPAPALPRRAAP